MIASMPINKRRKWPIFIIDLNTGFGLSPVEAEALYARITRFNSDYYEGSGGPGSDSENSCRFGRTREQAYIAKRKEGIRDCGCVRKR